MDDHQHELYHPRNAKRLRTKRHELMGRAIALTTTLPIRSQLLLHNTGFFPALVAAHRCWRHAEFDFDLGTLVDWLRLGRQLPIKNVRDQGCRGGTVVCIGNGPSLARTDLDALANQNVIATNRAYKLLDRIRPAQFSTCVQDNFRFGELSDDLANLNHRLYLGRCFFDDELVPPDWIAERSDLTGVYLPVLKWFGHWQGKNRVTLKPRAYFGVGHSEDVRRNVFYGYSVIFSAIQLAMHWGAKRIVCIGIDMDFSGGVSFVAGVRHVFPHFDYETHCKPMFRHLQQVADQRGVELINSTPGGRMEEWARMPLSKAVAGGHIDRQARVLQVAA